MHEQEFERSVQQKMEELSFTPSAPVWERVEAEIRDRRKKRRLAFWLLPVMITFIATGYYLLTPLAEKPTSLQKPGFVEPDITRDEVGTQGKKAYANAQKKNRVNAAIGNQPIAGKFSLPARIIPVEKKSVQKGAAAFTDARPGGEEGQLDPANASNDLAIHTDERQRPLTEIPLIYTEKSSDLLVINPAPATQVVNPKPFKTTSASNWQWSLHFHYGRSQLASGVGNGSASFDFANMPSPVQGGTQNGNPGFWLPPMRVEDGPYVAWKVGLRRKIWARWHLHTGLQYARYTQLVAVGRKVAIAGFSDSRAFYDPLGSESYYYNRFQLAGVPLVLQYKPFRKIPLELEAGLVPAYLFGAKALRLDTATRLYVEHKPGLHKLQLPVMAGIQYRFAKNKSWEYLAGAQLQHHLTGIHTRSGVPRLFAFSMGVQLRSR